MSWDLPPFLGIGIPIVIIATIGYGGHLFIFYKYLTTLEQIKFQICLTMVWISYLMAIFSDPGSPPKDFKPSKQQWRIWCRKCKCFKPERTHHCKTCRKCVKQMDHHCPWIANCVGHDNLPHFLRFLVWVDYTNGYAFIQLLNRGISLWKDRALPIYLISKSELVSVIILFPLSFMVLVSVGIMSVRWFYALIFRGMTQVETWEYERIESNLSNTRFIEKVKSNYFQFTGKHLQSILSWLAATRYSLDDDNEESETSPFDSDDIIFPYDLNPLYNLLNTCGYPWSWVLPWGKPLGDGVSFEKNEYFDGDENDLSSIPWPPDGNHDEPNSDNIYTESKTLHSHDASNLKRRVAFDRNEWFNDYGDKLSDFGVDIDA